MRIINLETPCYGVCNPSSPKWYKPVQIKSTELENLEYATLCFKDAAERGELAVFGAARFLDLGEDAQKLKSEIIPRLDATVVYVDKTVDKVMESGIVAALTCGQTVEFRTITHGTLHALSCEITNKKLQYKISGMSFGTFNEAIQEFANQ